MEPLNLTELLTFALILFLTPRLEAEGPAKSGEEEFKAAVQKLRQPLDSQQAFNVSMRPGRFEPMALTEVFLGMRLVHREIDEGLAGDPKHAFEKIAAYHYARDGATLLGRLQSSKVPLTPERDLDLRWITNQLKAVNLLLDRAQLNTADVTRLMGEKSDLLTQRWHLQNRYYGVRGGPERLSVEQVQAALDPGTVVLIYFAAQSPPPIVSYTGWPSLAPDHLDLLVITRDRPIEAHRIDVSEDELCRLIGDHLPVGVPWRGVQPNPDAAAGKRTEPGRQLYDALIAPAEEVIAASQRIVIIPDGLLYDLPFASLRRRDASGASSYLVEWKPLHVVQSIKIYLQVLAQRERKEREEVRRSRRLVAFGDPDYGAPGRPSPMIVRSAVSRGLTAGLERLPGTSREVSSITDLFRAAEAPVEVMLRSHASEQQAKEKASHAAYLHFALHSVRDSEQFEDSYLALTLPKGPALAGEDGILEAWEVVDQMSMSADLVTLSACETGLGKAAFGEGVLSMAHAFQMAGAQSVVASLWRVSDDSTVDLMVRFYRNLLSGLPKDRALQEAQVAMLRGEFGRDRAAPFHWAAFQLFGDWR